MALPTLLSSVISAFQMASSTLFGAASDLASGHLENSAADTVAQIEAETQAGAAAAMARTEQDMERNLLDIRA
jgi:hypothetical protein